MFTNFVLGKPWVSVSFVHSKVGFFLKWCEPYARGCPEPVTLQTVGWKTGRNLLYKHNYFFSQHYTVPKEDLPFQTKNFLQKCLIVRDRVA